jgi:hypothetical protein
MTAMLSEGAGERDCERVVSCFGLALGSSAKAGTSVLAVAHFRRMPRSSYSRGARSIVSSGDFV